MGSPVQKNKPRGRLTREFDVVLEETHFPERNTSSQEFGFEI